MVQMRSNACASAEKVDEFEWIYPYSPLHNMRRPAGGTRQYPAMLITTGAEPWHTLRIYADQSMAGTVFQATLLLLSFSTVVWRYGFSAGKYHHISAKLQLRSLDPCLQATTTTAFPHCTATS